MIYQPNESEAARSDYVGVPPLSQGTQPPLATLSSRSQQMVVLAGAGPSEDAHERGREVNSSLASAMQDDDTETVKGLSADGHSYAGTIVRGVLRGDSE